MKRLLAIGLSTAAICAIVSATPVAAQDTMTPGPGYGYTNGPVGAAGAIVAAPFNAITGVATGVAGYATQPGTRCYLTRDSYGSEGRYTAVCDL
jgi:hypothetical protein